MASSPRAPWILPVPAPDSVTLKDPSQFRWIGKLGAPRVDVYEKSTGKRDLFHRRAR